jgi:hypothetical protein
MSNWKLVNDAIHITIQQINQTCPPTPLNFSTKAAIF